PGDDAATVTIEAFDRSGDRSALRNRALGPRSRVVGLVNGSLFFGGSFQQIGGYLRITSDQPIITFALFGGSRFLSAIGGQRPLQ
ncbi:MAG TPA: hypothetical protein VLV83_00160, partial [Acidobacteriota bacterium]|nr:hypothetical protein [Acidobacteriota bacterium]